MVDHQLTEPRNRSLTEVVDFLINVEQDLALVGRRLFGAPTWPYLRNMLFNKIANHIGTYDNVGSFRQTRPAPKAGFINRWIRSNPFWRFGRKQYVVLGSPVVYRVGGRAIDIFTDSLIEQLPARKTEFVRMTDDANDGKVVSGVRYISGTWLERAQTEARNIHAPVVNSAAISEVESISLIKTLTILIEEKFDLRIPIQEMCVEASIHYLAQHSAWRSYFERRRPEYVILGFQCYGYEGLVRAAHDAKAVVVEMQHGAFFRGHMGYHYPGHPVVEDRADIMFAFGKGWMKAVDHPSNTRVYGYGFAPVTALRRRLDEGTLVKQQQIALLTGDPFHRDFLVRTVEAIVDRVPTKSIVIRPHPSDQFDYADRLSEYIRSGRVSVVGNIDPVHDVIAKSESIVTGPSTTAFEGLALYCKVVCVPFKFAPYFAPLLDETSARIAETVDEIVSALETVEPPTNSGDFFEFKPPHVMDLLPSRQEFSRQ